jgi:hypothetical protein
VTLALALRPSEFDVLSAQGQKSIEVAFVERLMPGDDDLDLAGWLGLW